MGVVVSIADRFRHTSLIWFVPSLLVGLAAAYHGVWHAPFVFDDEAAILSNASLRTLWPPGIPLSPPAGGLPVSGRPIPNLTLALNFAVSGTAPWSYHAVNLALHGLAAWTLFAFLDHTLRRPMVAERLRDVAGPLAAAIALAWALHPLATAAVTYTTQRTEVLVSLFYLLTLHACARAAASPRSATPWACVAVVACLCGMATKEVMVSAPLLALLYDRTFVAGTFGGAWRARWKLHASLMATWTVLAWLVLDTGTRGGTAGLGLGISPLHYALTQGEAITRYLGLTVWPHPLVFDYGDHLATDWRVIAPACALVLALLIGTVLGLARRLVAAFPAALFFAVLAPSSSVLPVATQTVGEHRMYLPLAAVLTLAGAGLTFALGRRAPLVLVAAAVGLGCVTHARNGDYRSPETLWRDTVEKRPDNPRAHNNLATLLFERGDFAGGFAAAERAVALRPGYADAHRNLALAHLLQGRVSEAWAHAEAAQRTAPASAAGRRLLADVQLAAADALLRDDRLPQAIAAYEALIEADPRLARAHVGLGHALLLDGRSAEALPHLDAALALGPATPPVLTSRALALLDLGRVDQAQADLHEALRLDPSHTPARQILDGLP